MLDLVKAFIEENGVDIPYKPRREGISQLVMRMLLKAKRSARMGSRKELKRYGS